MGLRTMWYDVQFKMLKELGELEKYLSSHRRLPSSARAPKATVKRTEGQKIMR